MQKPPIVRPGAWPRRMSGAVANGYCAEEERLRPAVEKLAFTIQEAAAVSSIGQTSLYKAIREGRLKARKYGTRTVITRLDLQAFLDSLPPTSR
jgi:excisionase family DNA binding protein